ncbi:phospholipase D-like domain-containing protein [Micromonospora sp. NBC_01813]|uniref:phospholipase D-like domain-containing protein n=1 Tax=Micromonospora sp. NBC_01813 TaxID=2975988 RepID=UPI002DDB7B97|nr:phospholipase D-like domain-containing protein [Micromonospora sp. NBC_01813]WSA08792.1 phospholipase D-like domain-containing protein [Micromonospora sp. NBC_01813]
MNDLPAGNLGQVIDLGKRTVEGTFFLRRQDGPPIRSPFIPRDTGSQDGVRHCLTYDGGGSNIREELVRLIDSATRRVFVATLFLGDEQVRQALERAVDRLQGGVYVVSALDDRGLNKAINDASDTLDVDTQIEFRNFTRLTTSGIYVRGYPGLHAKFAVVDDARALVSSANLVTRSFTCVGENGMVLEGVDEVAVLSWAFRRLWRQSPWDMPPAPSYHSVRDRSPADDALNEVAETGRLLWTWQDQHRILDDIRRTIDQAEHELILGTFSIGNMTFDMPKAPARPEILYDPVCRAIERGVRVRMLLRGRNHVESSRAEAAAFQAAGVEIYADTLTHAKGCLADRRIGSLFSANFMTTMGLTGGMELGMRLDGTGALGEAWRYFEHYMAETDLDLAVNPLAGVTADRLLADSLRPWPPPGHGHVTCDGQTWTQLATHTGPALWEQDGDHQLVYSGTRCYRISGEGARWRIEPANSPAGYRNSRQLLEGWISPRRGNRSGNPISRGIFAPVLSRDG